MKIKLQAFALAICAMSIASCDDNTDGLGMSLIPADDMISVASDSCFATSRTIVSPDSLLIMSSQCNVGRWTEPIQGALFETGFLTQLNCTENFSLPDSIYGIGDHRFPDWFIDDMEGVDPYYANLRMYFTSYFGDAQNPITLQIFELDRMIDASAYYYPSIDPARFCNLDKEPLATVTVSAQNFQDSDSLRSLSTYYPSVSVRLPDEIATRILNAYYSENGSRYFKNSETFMENLCKGFYIRCSQGDGTILYIDQSILQVNFKCIETDDDDSTYVGSYMAEFNGNSEVMQMNSFKWTGLESRMNDNSFSWIMSPFGLLTEISLPVDEMKKDGSVLNSAQICISSATTPANEYGAKVPPYLMLIRKTALKEFFSKNSTVDSEESFVCSYTSKYGTYTYENIAALVEKAYSDRSEWLKDNGLNEDQSGFEAYAKACPDWDKVVLVPVTPETDSNSSVLGYTLDIGMHQVKLTGGVNGGQIKIKTIRSHF